MRFYTDSDRLILLRYICCDLLLRRCNMIDGIIIVFKGDVTLLYFSSKLIACPLVAALGFGGCSRPLIRRIWCPRTVLCWSNCVIWAIDASSWPLRAGFHLFGLFSRDRSSSEPSFIAVLIGCSFLCFRRSLRLCPGISMRNSIAWMNDNLPNFISQPRLA
jgi:hypothetical protein